MAVVATHLGTGFLFVRVATVCGYRCCLMLCSRPSQENNAYCRLSRAQHLCLPCDRSAIRQVLDKGSASSGVRHAHVLQAVLASASPVQEKPGLLVRSPPRERPLFPFVRRKSSAASKARLSSTSATATTLCTHGSASQLACPSTLSAAAPSATSQTQRL